MRGGGLVRLVTCRMGRTRWRSRGWEWAPAEIAGIRDCFYSYEQALDMRTSVYLAAWISKWLPPSSSAISK